MLDASDRLDSVVCRAAVVEDRTWRHGIEIISHVNYDQLARVRVALGVMPDACGQSVTADILPAVRRAEASPPGRASTELVLWTDIMEQIVRIEDPPPPLKLLRSA